MDGTEIQGLPAGVELRPMGNASTQTTIQGLPDGAELRPIGGAGASASLDANPRGEGTYAMWDTAGKMHQIPYSLVNHARGQGFQFDTNPIKDASNPDRNGLTPSQAFTRDEAADPHRTGGTSMMMAPPEARWNAPEEPQSRQESLERLGEAEKNAPLPMRVITGVAKGGATLARPAIDVMNLGADGNTPAEQSYMLEGRTPAETAAKVGTVGAALVPAAIAAPVATAAGLAGGAAAGYVGSAAADAMGADPKVSAVVGDVAGLAGGAAAGMGADALTSNIARRAAAPLGETVVRPRGTVPAEFASPAELKAYADEHGIPLNAAQATEHNLPRNLQSAGERATIGGTQVKQQIRAGQSAVIDHAQSLMNGFSPDTPDLATAGAKIQENIAAALDREKQAAQQAYAQIDDSADGVKVDLRPLKKEASALLGDSSFIRQNISSLDPKRASAVVQGVTSLPNQASFAQAQQLRSALLDESRHPDVVISQQGQGWIKKLSGTVDQQMQQAAGSTPELMNKFRAANAHWEGVQEAFNNPRSPLYQALQEVDANKVPQKFTSKGQIGGSPYNAELLDRYGIDKGPIKWALMGDMIGKDFGLYNGGKTLAGYSDPFLESMFEPGELESIYKTGAIARSLRANTNPSGTAAVEGAMSDVQRPIKSLLPKAAAAYLTNEERFNNWLMNNPEPPSTDIDAFSDWLNRRYRFESAAAGAAVDGTGHDGKKK
jgi:hypothetical protein